MREFSSKTPIEVEKWDGRKEDFFGRDKAGLDERVIGPKSTTFPMIEGWKMDGKAVRLDRLTIRTYTDTLKLI